MSRTEFKKGVELAPNVLEKILDVERKRNRRFMRKQNKTKKHEGEKTHRIECL